MSAERLQAAAAAEQQLGGALLRRQAELGALGLEEQALAAAAWEHGLREQEARAGHDAVLADLDGDRQAALEAAERRERGAAHWCSTKELGRPIAGPSCV